jgi:hypothetical protein
VKSKIVLLLALLVLSSLAAPLRAQGSVERLEQLVVDLWPDFDRPAVLVLLTGRLPVGTAFPAELSIPVPEEATLHAVAIITSENQLFEVPYTLADGRVELSVQEQRFRVEYYLPYDADGLNRSFTFNWQSAMAIDDLNVSIQQPAAATSMTTRPAAEVTGQAGDGLTYHDFVTSLAPNQPFELAAEYEMSSAQLTAGEAAVAPPISTVEEAATGWSMNWPLFLGGAGLLFILLALIWQLWGNRAPAGPPRKPGVRREARPDRAASGQTGSARYCHNCGARAEPGDRFCRECGTALRQ